MAFYFIFLFSSPYVPIIPKEGVKANLFFPGRPDDARNRALIAFREKLIGISMNTSRMIRKFINGRRTSRPDIAARRERLGDIC
jgi:hypothetical protein